MATSDHDRACDLFLKAVDLDEHACAALLDAECGDDPELMFGFILIVR